MLKHKQFKTPKQHVYPSDLIDAQWQLLSPLFKLSSNKPARKYPVRQVLNAILYVNRMGDNETSCRTASRHGKSFTTNFTGGGRTVHGIACMTRSVTDYALLQAETLSNSSRH
jgi:hypothetical protein